MALPSLQSQEFPAENPGALSLSLTHVEPCVRGLGKSVDGAEHLDLGALDDDLRRGAEADGGRDALHGQGARVGRGALGGRSHAGVRAWKRREERKSFRRLGFY